MADPAATTIEWYVAATEYDRPFADRCEAEAKALVAPHIKGVDIPDVVRERAELEVSADLFYRKQSRNGVMDLGNGEINEPWRMNRDPLAAAYPFIRPFVPLGLG